MSRVLVTGAAGFLGGETVRQAVAQGEEVVGTIHQRRPATQRCPVVAVDLRDAGAARELVLQVRPEVLIHTAYRQVDWELTAVAPGHLAAAAREVGAEFVQVSSDVVFSGRAERYPEDARPDPVSPYGGAKAAAETAVRAVHPGSTVVRTSLLLGGPGSVMDDLVRAIVEGRSDAVLFTDDTKCAVHVSDVAGAVLELVGEPGVHHAAGPDAVTRWEIGVGICAREGWPTDRLRAGTRAAAGLLGPAALRLDSTRTQARLRTRLRGARELFRALAVSSTTRPGA